MDVYISADVEGVAGIADWDQIIPGGHDYELGRTLMAGEVNAAIEGAFLAGADRVVVNDAHARMCNLAPDSLDPRARLVSGRFKPTYMLQGLDETFDAVFFVGYHGSIGQPEAILSHTYNPDAVWEARIDDIVVGELGLNLLVCEYFGVPLRLVTGDQVTAIEARDRVPGVYTTEVKRSFGRFAAEHLSPRDARDLIRRDAAASLEELPVATPARRPVDLELTFVIADMAAVAEWIPGVERIGPRAVRLTATDGLKAYQAFHALLLVTRSLGD